MWKSFDGFEIAAKALELKLLNALIRVVPLRVAFTLALTLASQSWRRIMQPRLKTLGKRLV
jgi:hypothetical protein